MEKNLANILEVVQVNGCQQSSPGNVINVDKDVKEDSATMVRIDVIVGFHPMGKGESSSHFQSMYRLVY